MVMGQTYTLTHRRTQPTIVQDIHISNLITDQNFNIQTDRKLRPSIEHLSNQELTSLINNKQWQQVIKCLSSYFEQKESLLREAFILKKIWKNP